MDEASATSLPYHVPALLTQSLDALDIRPGGVYVDCTLGGGGHSRAILARLDAARGGRLLSFDQDRAAIARAASDPDFAEAPGFTAILGNFRYLKNFLRFYGADSVDGILADLGVSFHHFDDPSRGFSFPRLGGDAAARRLRGGTGRQLLSLRRTAPGTSAGPRHRYGPRPRLGRHRRAAAGNRKAPDQSASGEERTRPDFPGPPDCGQ